MANTSIEIEIKSRSGRGQGKGFILCPVDTRLVYAAH